MRRERVADERPRVSAEFFVGLWNALFWFALPFWAVVAATVIWVLS